MQWFGLMKISQFYHFSIIYISIGGIGGIIWYVFSIIDSWYILIAFIVPIITGILFITGWFIGKKDLH
jgi:hypothetical protein